MHPCTPLLRPNRHTNMHLQASPLSPLPSPLPFSLNAPRRTCTGQLYFIKLENLYEGELNVGLGRATVSATEANFPNGVKMKWYARREWIKERAHLWTKNPTFDKAKNPDTGRGQWTTDEKFEDILALLPELTNHTKDKPSPRLTAPCVVKLKALALLHNLNRPLEEGPGPGEQPNSRRRHKVQAHMGMDMNISCTCPCTCIYMSVCVVLHVHVHAEACPGTAHL